MIVEIIFQQKDLNLKAREVKERLENYLNNLNLKIDFTIKSVTIMSKWLVILVDFPDLDIPKSSLKTVYVDVIAGSIIMILREFNIRYLHYEVHGKTRSLLYHKEWEKERYE